jgi:hypothetical protein
MHLPAEFMYDRRHVIAYGFRQAGGRNSDEFCSELGHDVLQSLFEIGSSAIDRMFFSKR